ncbi:MAG: hypothetical protein R3300_10380 [Candidatus Promineifilaceae bacterium]|nr:hypothetical protein [Candidatus Promineifilaceae bacterium]
MRRKIVVLSLTVVLLALLAAATVAAERAFPERFGLPDGFFPEGIVVGEGHTFYTGSLLDGTLYRGDLRTGEAVGTSAPTGQSSVGLAYDARSGYVYAASGQGPEGRVAVFDGESLALVENVSLSSTAGFVNDVVVTEHAAYLTDSFVPVLYRLPLDADTGQPDPSSVSAIALSGDYQSVQGFNANGIVATPDGRWLIIVNSSVGALYRVDPSSGVATAMDLGGAAVTSGDGLVLAGKQLYVVQNALQQIAVFRLEDNYTVGQADGVISLPNTETPTTADRFGSRLYVVDARFVTGPGPDVAYHVVSVGK